MTPNPAARERIRDFLAVLDATPRPGCDPDVIYALHSRTELPVELRASDLRALLGDAPAPKRELPPPAAMVEGRLSPTTGLNRAVIEAMGREAVANYG